MGIIKVHRIYHTYNKRSESNIFSVGYCFLLYLFDFVDRASLRDPAAMIADLLVLFVCLKRKVIFVLFCITK